MSTLIMLNHDALVDAYDAAKAKCADDARWLAALESAYEWLTDRAIAGEGVVVDGEHVQVASRTVPGKTYWANGECSCQAHIVGNPCWHRAAARLVKRALEQPQVRRPKRSAEEKARIAAEMNELFT